MLQVSANWLWVNPGLPLGNDDPIDQVEIVPSRDNRIEGAETITLVFAGRTATLLLEDYIPCAGGNGDVNGDSYYDIIDALMVARYYV